jgi:hypothetical protein
MKPTNQDVAEAKAENVVNALRAALYFSYNNNNKFQSPFLHIFHIIQFFLGGEKG